MNEPSGHKISPESVHLSQKHSDEATYHAEMVKAVGEAMATEAGQSIQAHGKAMQEHLEAGQPQLDELKQTASPEAFVNIVADHIETSQVHVEATKEFLAVSKQQPAKLAQQETFVSHRQDLYEQLMVLNHNALEAQFYETAYHTLAAAFHWAEAMGDEQRLLAIGQAAKVQQEWIDTHAPGHRLSTQSTTQRMGTSLYDSLARQAAAQVLITKQKGCQEQARPLPWSGDTASS